MTRAERARAELAKILADIADRLATAPAAAEEAAMRDAQEFEAKHGLGAGYSHYPYKAGALTHVVETAAKDLRVIAAELAPKRARSA